MITIFVAGIAAGTTILLAALGEIVTERAGVLNLGVEGMMLVGAVTGFVVNLRVEDPWLGALAAVAAGALLGVLHAVLVVGFRTNQVVTGLALVIFAQGLSGYVGQSSVGVAPPETFRTLEIPGLSSIPVLGRVLFSQDALVYLSFLLVAVLWWFLFRMRPGLNLRSVGESPESADAVGISVARTRYAAVAVGGGFAGLGGAYLSLAQAPSWIPNMTAGRGWIAIALVNLRYVVAGAGGFRCLPIRLRRGARVQIAGDRDRRPEFLRLHASVSVHDPRAGGHLEGHGPPAPLGTGGPR